MITSIPFLEVRVPESSDFMKLKEMAYNDNGWILDYGKGDIKIWSRVVDDSSIKMVKVWAVYPRINSLDVYNTIMDSAYRKEWDTNMVLGYEVGYVSSNSSIIYYGASCPFLKKRDVVLQHSWLDRGIEHYVMNHSVCHKDHPPRSGFIRAISYFTGYYIKTSPNEGCEMWFVSQTDPQGIIPAWIINKCTTIFAPRIVRNLERAAFNYSSWKAQNDPNNFPWIYPEHRKNPIIPITDCIPSEEEKQSSFYLNLINKLTKSLVKIENSENLIVSNEENFRLHNDKFQGNGEGIRRRKKCKTILYFYTSKKQQKSVS